VSDNLAVQNVDCGAGGAVYDSLGVCQTNRDTFSWSGMSGAVPVPKPVGRAMIVGNAGCRGAPRGALSRVGYQCAELEDPYAAMAELCRRPLVYRALIISLNSFFAEELPFIAAVKRRFPHIEIWLTDLEGRQAALAEALRLGADGLVSEDGLHRIAGPRLESPLLRREESADEPEVELEEAPPAPPPAHPAGPEEAEQPLTGAMGEPVLTAEELRALLQDQPMPRDEHPET
jgi:hypothetical protein